MLVDLQNPLHLGCGIERHPLSLISKPSLQNAKLDPELNACLSATLQKSDPQGTRQSVLVPMLIEQSRLELFLELSQQRQVLICHSALYFISRLPSTQDKTPAKDRFPSASHIKAIIQ